MKYVLLALLVFLNPKTSDSSYFTEQPFALVELFTSQGCSSCPPADELLSQVKEQYKDQNVYVISYHVDYWNRLGWKDPFSSATFTQLQYNYGSKFSLRSVYTPQAVINGQEHFVGSKETVMRTKLRNYLDQNAANGVDIGAAGRSGGSVAFEYAVSGDRSGKQLKAVVVLEEKTTYVPRGENRKRSLTNENIAIATTQISLAAIGQGKATIALPDIVENKDKISLILFVQDQNFNITGAKSISLH